MPQVASFQKLLHYNSTSYQNCIFQNKIYYLIVSKIAILNDDHDIYHSSLLNIEKKNLSNIFLKIYLFIYYLLKGILPKRHNCLIMKIIIIKFN